MQNLILRRIGLTKKLWKALRSIFLPDYTLSCSTNGFAINKLVKCDIESILKCLKIFFKSVEKSFKKTSETSE